MALSNKVLESINEADLQALLVNQIAEGKTLEYKEALPGGTDSDRKEFLYDISSFANASGGHLIYGIKEDGGFPTEIRGLDITDVDAVILKLESSIQDGIAPRIPGLRVKAIHLHNTRVAIVFHIPRSFSLPHMVTFKNAARFYSRNSAGKYQLDVGELRTAFTLSQSITDRIRNFRQERLSNIVAQETPVSMAAGGKLVMHIIPIGAFDPAFSFDVASLYNKSSSLFEPLTSQGGWNQRYNFDGHLTLSKNPDESFAYSYLQTFRNGIIEAVDAETVTVYNGRGVIFSEYEWAILQAIPRYLTLQENLGVEPPFFIMLSFLGVKGYVMGNNSGFGYSSGSLIDRDALLVPEVIVEDFNFNIAQVMKPIFDAVWNAAGYTRSLHYDHDENWVER